MSKNESLDEGPFLSSDDESFHRYGVRNSVDNSKTLSTPFGPLHYMVAAAGVSLILFVIYVVYQQARLSQNEAPPLPEISDSCEHRFCARVQLSNPSSHCLLDAIAVNQTVSRSTNSLTIRGSHETTVIADYSSAYPSDLPPSYITSVRYDCPPSYEEAVSLNYETNQYI
ncbi:hypothetical protein RN001_010809 [Aquatica leii]|uniref:Uncharacterized protein n=1 Tax=Aquatica leii TaxID=1421715 RepID=A0AAN7P8B8_9COLE|nr:hypothetical protein RN001_010809 [Aquatica leii]